MELLRLDYVEQPEVAAYLRAFERETDKAKHTELAASAIGAKVTAELKEFDALRTKLVRHTTCSRPRSALPTDGSSLPLRAVLCCALLWCALRCVCRRYRTANPISVAFCSNWYVTDRTTPHAVARH